MLQPTKLEVYVQSSTKSHENLSRLFSETLTSLYERRKFHELSVENLDSLYQLSLSPLLTEEGIISPENRERIIPYTDKVVYNLGKNLKGLDLTIEVRLTSKKSKGPETYLRIR